MDPTACYRMMMEAMNDGRHDDAYHCAKDLDWLGKGWSPCQASGWAVRVLIDHVLEHYKPLEFDEFTEAYIICALWASTDDQMPYGMPLDDKYDRGDIDREILQRMITDCRNFQMRWQHLLIDDNLLVDSCTPEEQGGHDFWLTRNGHGAGFWDGDWKKEVGEFLTAYSKKVGGYALYVGDDDKIHGSGN